MFWTLFKRKQNKVLAAAKDTPLFDEAVKNHEVEAEKPFMDDDSRPELRKSQSEFNDGHYSDLEAPFEEPPEAYWPPCSDTKPPLYSVYDQVDRLEVPEFPRDATKFALRESRPPQPSAAEYRDRLNREEVQGEQGQYINSIKYGDQVKRGLDELKRFQEDRMSELGEKSGLTAEQIERRRKLSSWEGDREEWCLTEEEGIEADWPNTEEENL